MRTRSTQWEGDPGKQSEKHDSEKEITKKNVQSTEDLKMCVPIIPYLFRYVQFMLKFSQFVREKLNHRNLRG